MRQAHVMKRVDLPSIALHLFSQRERLLEMAERF
jgi:hypothetical protein